MHCYSITFTRRFGGCNEDIVNCCYSCLPSLFLQQVRRIRIELLNADIIACLNQANSRSLKLVMITMSTSILDIRITPRWSRASSSSQTLCGGDATFVISRVCVPTIRDYILHHRHHHHHHPQHSVSTRISPPTSIIVITLFLYIEGYQVIFGSILWLIVPDRHKRCRCI